LLLKSGANILNYLAANDPGLKIRRRKGGSRKEKTIKKAHAKHELKEGKESLGLFPL